MSSEDHRTTRSRFRRTNRTVASQVGARFARPDDDNSNSAQLPHSTKATVSSTPFGDVSLLSDDRNSSTNNDESEAWCGPFSVARQMINDREAAKRKLEESRRASTEQALGHHPLDQILAKSEKAKVLRENPSQSWKAVVSADDLMIKRNYYAKRRRRYENSRTSVKSLFSISRDFIVDNLECVEGLGDVDSNIRKALSLRIVETNKMDGEALKVIAEPGVEVLEIVDCARISEDVMATTLSTLVDTGLTALNLNYCGRCFCNKGMKAIIDSYERKTGILESLSIGGAYNITDVDVGKLLETLSPTLKSIEFKACPQLGMKFSEAVAQYNNLMELSLEDIPLTKSCLLRLATSKAASNLRSLSLVQVDEVDDDIIQSFLKSCGEKLEGLHLKHLRRISDVTLSNIRLHNTKNSLRSLSLSGLAQLTSAGLETLFTGEIEGMPNAPMLRELDLSESKSGTVTDEVITSAAKASSMKYSGSKEGVSNLGGLVFLNINGANNCTDKSLEVIAATCYSSLVELDASFCSLISDQGLGFLVSKVRDQFEVLHLWGCAQITDSFLDGHRRVRKGNTDSAEPLNIVGTWMKRMDKSGM